MAKRANYTNQISKSDGQRNTPLFYWNESNIYSLVHDQNGAACAQTVEFLQSIT